jgi:ribokinase
MSTSFDVCVVGSANLDLVAIADRLPGPGETVLGSSYSEHAGGKGLNQAVAAARSGARTAFVGAVGRDQAGDTLLDVLDGDGIDRTAVLTVDLPTGRALIAVDAQAENSIVVVPGANGEVRVDRLPRCSVVLTQLEIPLDVVAAALAAARAAGAVTVLNPAPAASLPDDVVADCDLIVPNEHEVGLLGGPARLLELGCRAVVVTRGGEGVEIHRRGGVEHRPAHPVDVIDTTGAGDAFCGALAARLARAADLDAAVDWAMAAGALATSVVGAVPAQPTAAAIEARLASIPTWDD